MKFSGGNEFKKLDTILDVNYVIRKKKGERKKLG